jgi:hypothetical protein
MTQLLSAILLALLVFSPAAAGPDCSKCKCTQYPVESKCTDCCPVVQGTVKSVAPQAVTIASATGGDQTFSYNSDTVVKGEAKENVHVVAVYRRGTQIVGYVEFGN